VKQTLEIKTWKKKGNRRQTITLSLSPVPAIDNCIFVLNVVSVSGIYQ